MALELSRSALVGPNQRFGPAVLLVLLASAACCAVETTGTRDFHDGWKFVLGDAPSQAIEFDDSAWRVVHLPHDWSVEAPFDEKLEGCTAYLPGGVGWYRKRFPLSLGDDQVAYLCFDGVYNRSEIWLNEEKLGFHPYGYSPFYFEITDQLSDANQVVAVKVDHSRYADSRWYTGSGIYRKASLRIADKLHIPVWGTFVTTPEVSDERATVDVKVDVRNAYDESRQFALVTKLLDAAGKVIAKHRQEKKLSGNTRETFQQSLVIESPRLWGIEAPNLYSVKIEVVEDGEVVDTQTTRFGVRRFHFDAEKGFFLNGERTLIKGVCLHHDAGLVGTAVPKGVWRRRLLTLIEGGCNAIRTAHNPPSEEFLDLCDELGLLVQDEFYDEWDYPKDKRLNQQERHDDYITRGHHEFFQEWAEPDLKATMLRDRNHPCVFQWSIGNEIEWTYKRYRPATGYFNANWKGNYFWTPPPLTPDEIRKRYEQLPPEEYVLADTAQKLADWTREVDTTRPVTSNCILPSASHVTGYADALDIVGYSYRRVVYDYARRHFPDKVVMGTENLGQWHDWKAVMERPFISGLFLWTGVDYLGEANERWPKKGLSCGLLDTAGFKKPSFHMLKTLWKSEPHVYLATQLLESSDYKLKQGSSEVVPKKPDAWTRRVWSWHPVNRHWNYQPGEMVVAEVYANADRVELFLNDQSLGMKSLSDFPDRIFKWAVPFEPGVLTASMVQGDVEVVDTIATAGEAERIALGADRSSLSADNEEVLHVTAQLVDANGVPVRTADREIVFQVEGPIRLLGVDNGSLSTVERFQTDRVPTHEGRCLLLVQATDEMGVATIRANAGSIQSEPFTIEIEP